MSILSRAGCPVVTDQLDILRCSPYGVNGGGQGDIYAGFLCSGDKVAIKTGRGDQSLDVARGHITLKVRSTRKCILQAGLIDRTMILLTQRVAREVYTWFKVDHQNVAQLLGMAMFRGHIAMVSSWIEPGDFYKFINRFPNANRMDLCVQVARGLSHLHESRIVFGDLKAVGTLYHAGLVKLTDFGLSILEGSGIIFTVTSTGNAVRGTTHWMAPELFRGSIRCSFEADMYALAMTFIEMFTDDIPFPGLMEAVVILKVVYEGEIPARPQRLIVGSVQHDWWWSFMQRCWSREPSVRPKAATSVHEYGPLFIYGKYGILHIVNRKNNSPAYSYPVDSEHTTFGRDDGCDIRLLYGWVSGLHCKLFFQSAKAFLTVYGLNGVIVDGCHIARNPDADDESSETTIPIMNNSQIEIFRKRFVFEYPSKELRAKARAEPATVKPRRTLRLSMIQSAQVFTPRNLMTTKLPSLIALDLPQLRTSVTKPSRVLMRSAKSPWSEPEALKALLCWRKRRIWLWSRPWVTTPTRISDEEEIIKDKKTRTPLTSDDPLHIPRRLLALLPLVRPRLQPELLVAPTRLLTPNRPTLNRSAASVPAPAPPPAPAQTPQQPARTPARRPRFSLHKAVLLRSAQRQLIERERLNQLQAREPTIFDEEGDAEMSDVEPEFVEEPETEPSETSCDPHVDARLASEVGHLSVDDADAEEEDAVEAVVSPARRKSDHGANGSFSDDSERSMSEGDVSIESDISEEHEPEEKSSSRLHTTLSFLGGLLRSPTKKKVEDAEEEEDIVDLAVTSKTRPSVWTDSDNEEDDSDDEVDAPEVEAPSASEEDDVHTPTEAETTTVDVHGVNGVKSEPADYFEDKAQVESTPVQPRRLNVFMTPQVARPNFPRLAAGRKSVAVATPGSAVGDVSWLPEEEKEFKDEEVSLDVKSVPELGFEERAARRQSALAVLAAGPRQLPSRRQSVAPHLAKSEPFDPNNRRMTLASTELAAIPGTPQHASSLAQSTETAVVEDSSDEEEPVQENPLDTLRKKIDHMRRQSMHRAARESAIGPLFKNDEVTSSENVKLEDSEGIDGAKRESTDGLEESEHEFDEESQAESELEVETEEEAVTQSEAETETEAEEGTLPEASDAESELVSEQEEELGDVTIVASIPTGPSTPALKGTPAGLDGMIDMFGPEFEPTPVAEPELELEVETKSSRLRTKSANPTRLKAPSATGMARAKSAQSRLRPRKPRLLRLARRTPVEEPASASSRTSTKPATMVVSVELPRRAATVKQEPAEEPVLAESKLKAPAKRITRTASATSSSTGSQRLSRTASSISSGRASGRTTPSVPEEQSKPIARATRAKAATSGLPARSRAAAPARVTTPVNRAEDEQDPMDIMTMPESPTKRSTRTKTLKAEAEEDETAHTTRSRTRSGESETTKGKRTTSRRVAAKATEETRRMPPSKFPRLRPNPKSNPAGYRPKPPGRPLHRLAN
ncbi:FHA domain protein [Ceratobasidium sp. AG-Ba]|nr:FHA domain protein [Ceratobasidium sp. AG-Ba]